MQSISKFCTCFAGHHGPPLDNATRDASFNQHWPACCATQHRAGYGTGSLLGHKQEAARVIIAGPSEGKGPLSRGLPVQVCCYRTYSSQMIELEIEHDVNAQLEPFVGASHDINVCVHIGHCLTCSRFLVLKNKSTYQNHFLFARKAHPNYS